jgi:membrane fusion protein (multidrug efflux system)
MKREWVVGTAVLCAAILGTAACKKKEEPKPAPPPPTVVVTPVIQRDVPVLGEWIGTTAGDINASIRPQITGYLLRRVYAEGSFVRNGQLLFEIDPRQLQAQLAQAQANLGQGQAQLVKAGRDLARYRPLAEQRAVSQQELDAAVAAEQVAQANVEAYKAQVDQARLNLTWTRVTSPIDGIAGASVAQVGDLLTPQTVLATVSRVDPLRVLFNLSEQEYLHYREMSQADPATAQRISELQMTLTDGKVYPQRGRLIFTDRQVDEKTGTISAVGLFPNPGNMLRPGQYAKVHAVTAVERGALLVPQRAVNEFQGGFQVAIVGPGGKADVLNVQTGQRVGNLWVIEHGLQPGEQVVVDGFSQVKAGAQVNVKQATPQQAGLAPPQDTAAAVNASTSSAGAGGTTPPSGSPAPPPASPSGH